MLLDRPKGTFYRIVAHSPVFPILPPLEAYRADLSRAGVDQFGPADALWLQIALAFRRLGDVEAENRAAVLQAAASALASAAAVVSTDDSGAAVVPTPAPSDSQTEAQLLGAYPYTQMADALRAPAAAELARAAHVPVDPDVSSTAADALLTPIQHITAHMERVGAFRLAYSTLASTFDAFPHLPMRARARLLVQQGRIARQIGELTTASELYTAAERLARQSRDDDDRVRAVIGRGVLASTRGNYPEARLLLRRALRYAMRAQLDTHIAAAHQGLLMAAAAAGDTDAALQHGWTALQYASDDPEQRAAILGALGGVSLQGGYPAAALHAYAAVLAVEELPRQRLPALGGAAVAAACLNRPALLEKLAQHALHEIRGSQHVFENAFTMLELAEAHCRLADRAAARVFLATAMNLAHAHGFFEILHRAAAVESVLDSGEVPFSRAAAADAVPSQVDDAGLTTRVPTAAVRTGWARTEAVSISRPALRVVHDLERLTPAMDLEGMAVC